jgi:hypothetical protein
MPRYKHDCKNCTFLGEWRERDLYHCLQGGNYPTVVARFSDEPEDYISGLRFALELESWENENNEEPLVEAYRRAKALGLKIK